MNIFIIEKYIKRITKQDIYNYCVSINLKITDKEIDILYSYLKTYYHEFLTNKQSRPKLIQEIKPQVSDEVFSKLEELYNTYKDKL